jgi:hypothetical protein
MRKLNYSELNLINGTSFYDVTIKTSINQLTKVLGEPSIQDNTGEDKVNAEWQVITEDGVVGKIYDWKEYRRLDRDDLVEFHIGGYDKNDTRQVGLIAQEVQEVLPEIVSIAPVDNDGQGGSKTGEDYLTIDYSKVVPLLVECINALGDKASGDMSKLVVYSVAGKYRVTEYDGFESIETPGNINWIDPTV